MFYEQNFLLPRLNGEPFLEYPPLCYWLIAGSYGIFGVNDFAAKFPSCLAALATVLLTFSFARMLGLSVGESLLSGIILISSTQFFFESRTCRVDMLLTFFMELAVFSFYAAIHGHCLARRISFWLLFVFSLACASYTKGLIGILLPGAVIGAALVADDIRTRSCSWTQYAAAACGGILALCIVGLWYALLWNNGGYEMFHSALVTNNFGRFNGSQQDHAESFFYYFAKMPALFQPWLLFLFCAFISALRHIRINRTQALLHIVLAISVPFALLCCASNKRIVYLLPLCAPSSLLVAWFLFHLPERIKMRVRKYMPTHIGVLLLLFTLIGLVAVDLSTAVHQNRTQSLRKFFEHVAVRERQGKKIFLVDVSERTRGASYFYLHHNVPEKKHHGAHPDANECWIMRKKNAGIKTYADHHLLLEWDDGKNTT